MTYGILTDRLSLIYIYIYDIREFKDVVFEDVVFYDNSKVVYNDSIAC